MPRYEEFELNPLPSYEDNQRITAPRPVRVVEKDPAGGEITFPNAPDGGRYRSVAKPTTESDPVKEDPPKTNTDRLADILGDLFTQPLAFPSSSSEPVVIPTQTNSTSIIPILLIVAGIGGLGYYIYKKNHKAGENA